MGFDHGSNVACVSLFFGYRYPCCSAGQRYPRGEGRRLGHLHGCFTPGLSLPPFICFQSQRITPGLYARLDFLFLQWSFVVANSPAAGVTPAAGATSIVTGL